MSLDDPRIRTRYVFNADRAGEPGSRTQVAPYRESQHFTFWITARGVFMKSPRTDLVNEDLHLHNGVLEDRGYFYQNGTEWLTPPDWTRYRSIRAPRTTSSGSAFAFTVSFGRKRGAGTRTFTVARHRSHDFFPDFTRAIEIGETYGINLHS